MTDDEALDTLLKALIAERADIARIAAPADEAGKRDLLRALMNLRSPLPLRPDLLALQDQVLATQRERKGVVHPDDLATVVEQFAGTRMPFANRMVLWKGDITRLAAGAIVNAANAALLGCFIPHHRCIDNAIHSAAGMQLRLACHEIMQAQGHEEPTGQAKITPGYNLPAHSVLHTVGPILRGRVTPEDRRLLASCYSACLDLSAQDEQIRSVAFCCISTGEFHFPQDQAAQIAVETVCDWLSRSGGSIERVIFNVFTQEDYDLYAELFRTH